MSSPATVGDMTVTPKPAQASGRRSRPFSVINVLGVLFLVSQAIFILQTRFSEENLRLLTPVEGLTRYELHATYLQWPLDPPKVKARYGIPAHADSSLTPEALREVIKYREASLPPAQAMFVRLHSRRPDGVEDYWLWPQE